MEQVNTTSFEMKNDSTNRVAIKPQTAMRMLGVLLFYVVLFVAVSVFTN